MAQITVKLSSAAAREARSRAAQEGRQVEQYVADVLEEEFAPDMKAEEAELAKLSDDEVLAMADHRLSPAQDRRLSKLLSKNSDGTIKPAERQELDALMQLYIAGMLEKAKGWAEAVRRKLRKPVQG